MESEDTPYTRAELAEAGASRAFIEYYTTAIEMGERTAAIIHVESEHRTLEDVADAPHMGGGFFSSLWNDEPRWGRYSDNPYGADSTNSRILAEAGVEPYADPIPA